MKCEKCGHPLNAGFPTCPECELDLEIPIIDERSLKSVKEYWPTFSWDNDKNVWVVETSYGFGGEAKSLQKSVELLKSQIRKGDKSGAADCS